MSETEHRYRVTAYDPDNTHRILKRAVKVEERDEATGDVISSRVSNKQLRHEIDGAAETATVVARYVAEGVPVGVEGKAGALLRPETFTALAAALLRE